MKRSIAVVGLGYVGLPLAVAFGKRTRVVGFDTSPARIESLRDGVDRTNEVSSEDLAVADVLYTSDPTELRKSDFIIVAVPTPINHARRPELGPLERASRTVGGNLSPGAIVVYESTVYPGVTEEFCAPILEQMSGLVCGKDFFLGYSPERINPGDKVHTLEKIVKVVSGQTPEVLDIVAAVYESVVEAGVHRAANIKTAEAAKVIENTQRDLNIALVNELALIFDRMGIDTLEVLEAAGTKWNFLPFRPGLVGGHCIGVDPYYLTHKAEELGYHPQVILAGRRINDNMAHCIAEKAIKFLVRQNVNPNGARVAVFGLTFKEDVPDLRNSKVVDIVRELRDFEVDVQVCDPMCAPEEAREEYGIDLVEMDRIQDLDCAILAVPHAAFRRRGAEWIRRIVRRGGVVMDVKGMFRATDFADGHVYWRL
ncbi:nucleotide sugar dehydrogenase [Candidatus Sumerlaeota bacterium]|nr:nucleotide sugar dehydrogenase [Candidatus Sumerlaeota bacterium]